MLCCAYLETIGVRGEPGMNLWDQSTRGAWDADRGGHGSWELLRVLFKTSFLYLRHMPEVVSEGRFSHPSPPLPWALASVLSPPFIPRVVWGHSSAL